MLSPSLANQPGRTSVHIGVIALGVFLNLIGAKSAHPALPPSIYQDDAPDVVTIEVLERSVTPQEIALVSEVRIIHRTRSELVPGERIVVRYSPDSGKTGGQKEDERGQGWSGPGQCGSPAPPEKGEIVKAYVDATSESDYGRDVYEPVAQCWSFEVVEDIAEQGLPAIRYVVTGARGRIPVPRMLIRPDGRVGTGTGNYFFTLTPDAHQEIVDQVRQWTDVEEGSGPPCMHCRYHVLYIGSKQIYPNHSFRTLAFGDQKDRSPLSDVMGIINAVVRSSSVSDEIIGTNSDEDPSSGTCGDAVQGKIAWNYRGVTKWQPRNIKRLCSEAEDSVQPAECFRRVMHGKSGEKETGWSWKQAVAVCKGTKDANAVATCVEEASIDGASIKATVVNCGPD